MSNHARFARQCFSLAALVLFFSGCGGGGGGSDKGPGGGSGSNNSEQDYVGVTTAAKLDSATAPVLANALLFELDLGSQQLRPLPTKVGIQHFAAGKYSAKNTVVAVQRKSFWSQKATSENCTEGGALETDDQTNASGTGSVTLTFSNCIEDGVRANGKVIVRVDAFDTATGSLTDYTTAFEGFKLDAGGYSVTLNGTDRIQGVSLIETLNTVSHYQPENLYFRLDNFTITNPAGITPAAFGSATLQGRFYDSRYGYVDVDTAEALRLVWNDLSQPDQGTLQLRGAPPGQAKVHFTGPTEIALDLDSNGDGTYERGLSANLSAWLSSPNFAPRAHAGGDAQIDEGQSFTFADAGSTDWEGSTLTYNWIVLSGPSFGPISSGSTATFTPQYPGNYVVQLTVTDDHLQTGSDTMMLFVRDNAAPVANGKDVRALIGTAITLDATASADAENDPLQYTWQLHNAPPGAQAPTSATGAQVVFTPDRAGQYVYQVNVADKTGSSFDIVYINIEPVLTQNGIFSPFSVSPLAQASDLQQQLSFSTSTLYSGPALPLSISSDRPWLRVATASPMSNAPIIVEIDSAELESMANGQYSGELTITPQGFPAQTIGVNLSLSTARISHVSPYVGYENQPQEVVLFGQNVGVNLTAQVVINGIAVPGPSPGPRGRGRLTLPALPAGEYDMYFTNDAGLVQPGGRYVVRAAPSYANGELALSGRVESLDYDAERDAFFVVTSDANNQTQARRLKYNGSSWQSTLLSATAPQALTLTTDGSRLLVTTSNCGVLEFNPVTLTQTGSQVKPNCDSDVFGMIHALADGSVFVANTNQWPTVWRYPEFTIEYLPAVHNPIHRLSHNRTHLVWAESPTISPPRRLYLYDSTLTYDEIAPNDSGTYFLASNLAVSGDGRTLAHHRDIYLNREFVGSLNHSADPYLTPGLTRMGERAILLDAVANSIAAYDLTSSPPFPQAQNLGTLPDDIALVGNRIAILPTDDTAFVFTSIADGGGNISGYKLYVRNLP